MPSFTVSEIAGWIGGRIVNADALGPALAGIRVEKPAHLSSAGPAQVAFFFSRAFQHELPAAKPGILVTGEDFVKPLEAAGLPLWKKTAVIACADPYLGMAMASEKFAEVLSTVAHIAKAEQTEIHPSAVVDPTAELGSGVRVGPHCVVGEKAKIGARSVLYPGCFVGPSAVLGEDCVLFPGVVVYEWTQVGKRVRITPIPRPVRDGFGYAPRKEGGEVVNHQKIYHLGRVVLGDDVEIGANSCIDRGTLGDTRIENKVKIDNLVQVGHNCHVDEGAVLCGSVGLAGSARVGKFAYVGGMTGVGNQILVGDRARVGALSLVFKDVPPGAGVMGNPARDHNEHWRLYSVLSRMLAERSYRRGKAGTGKEVSRD